MKDKDKKKKKKKGSIIRLRVDEKPEEKFVEPDEWYPATFKSVTEKEGKFGPYMIMAFELKGGYIENTEDSAKGLNKVHFCNMKLTEGSKSMKTMEALAGKELEVDDEIEVNAYLGNSVKVYIEDAEGKSKKGEDVRRQLITKVKALKKKGK